MPRDFMAAMGVDRSDLDDVLDVLSAERRRVVLSVLSDLETPLTLPDMADEVAVRENEAPITEIAADDVKSIYLELYHTHVPKLTEIGALDYHQETDMVTPTENVAHLASILPALQENDSTSSGDRSTG